MSITVNFYNQIEVSDELLKFAVIAARFNGKWIFCRHKKRYIYEFPGGHREAGEKISDTAQREFWEETGVSEFELPPVCVYSVTSEGITTYGMLYTAHITKLGKLPKEGVKPTLDKQNKTINWVSFRIHGHLLKEYCVRVILRNYLMLKFTVIRLASVNLIHGFIGRHLNK